MHHNKKKRTKKATPEDERNPVPMMTGAAIMADRATKKSSDAIIDDKTLNQNNNRSNDAVIVESTKSENTQPKSGKLTPEEIAREKLVATAVATTIFKTLKPLEHTTDPESRHTVVMQKFQSFASAFPVITRVMCRELRFNEKAFSKFLDKMWADPGRGMEGVINHQANYLRLLWIEEQRAKGRRPNLVEANRLYQAEYNNMMKHMKKIQDEEKRAKNEFAEEAAENFEKRRAEVLDFIRTNTNEIVIDKDAEANKLTSIEKMMTRLSLGLPVKYSDVNIDDFGQDKAALAAFCFNVHRYVRQREEMANNARAAAAADAGAGPASETSVIVPDDETNPYLERDIDDLRAQP
jgi:hypothetical protein